MSAVRLSVQIATSGRPTLSRLLDSVIPQCDPVLDEVLLVGPLPALQTAIGERWASWPVGLVKVLPCVPRGDWGHTERNLTLARCAGTHLVFGDDDDVFTPGALQAIRQSVQDWPGPVMFRMRDHDGRLIWGEPRVAFANHGTPQFVIPNDPSKFGTFVSRHGGDYDFVLTTLAKYPPDSLKWDETVIYECRPVEVAA